MGLSVCVHAEGRLRKLCASCEGCVGPPFLLYSTTFVAGRTDGRNIIKGTTKARTNLDKGENKKAIKMPEEEEGKKVDCVRPT
jgi:hypothetical protein